MLLQKKDLHPLPFTEEVLDIMARHEVYLFFNGFSVSLDNDHPKRQVQDCLHYQLGNICLDSHAIWIEECSTHLLASNEYGIL
jgi:hypothetical protein